jgi:hypothetical protein
MHGCGFNRRNSYFLSLKVFSNLIPYIKTKNRADILCPSPPSKTKNISFKYRHLGINT